MWKQKDKSRDSEHQNAFIAKCNDATSSVEWKKKVHTLSQCECNTPTDEKMLCVRDFTKSALENAEARLGMLRKLNMYAYMNM